VHSSALLAGKSRNIIKKATYIRWFRIEILIV